MANWKRISIASTISAITFGIIMGKKLHKSPNVDVQDCMQDMIMCEQCRAAICAGAALFLARHMQRQHNWSEEVSILASKKMIHRYYHNYHRKEKQDAQNKPSRPMSGSSDLHYDGHDQIRMSVSGEIGK